MKTNKVITQTSLHSIVEHCSEDMSSKILNLSNGCKYKVVTLFKIYNYDLSPEIEGKKRLLRTPVCIYVNIE